MKKQEFTFFEHTADIKFQAYGKSLEKAFENSALAMFNVMADKKVNPKIKKKIRVNGKDLENLLYNFLEELIFLLDSQNFFISKTNLKIKKGKKAFELEGEILGDIAKNYEIKIDVKAITYNEMFVKKIKDRWVCQAVLDV
jgi:SHS2 domain-containing protein